METFTPLEIKAKYEPFVKANGESALLKKLMSQRWLFALQENTEKSLLVKSLPEEVRAVALPHMAYVYYEFYADKIIINIPIEGLATIHYSIIEEKAEAIKLDCQMIKEPFEKKSLEIVFLSESLIRVYDTNEPASLDHYLKN